MPSRFTPQRRQLLQWLASSGVAGAALGWPQPGHALPARALQFPRDHGAHPEFGIEWWYLTGQLRDAAGREFGFQITFFRSRVEAAQALSSRFAAKQLVFAHAAITDVQGKRMLHDQRAARTGFGLASASEATTSLQLGNWALARRETASTSSYQAEAAAADFKLSLALQATQPVLLQGKQGLSRKGPLESQASYYYSLPQLAASGKITLQGQAFEVTGKAWLDHEWSNALLHADAVGWDWIGMNMLDGSALTAFRLRRADGSTLWDGGSFRLPKTIGGGETYIFSKGEVDFKPLRIYQSPSSGTRYPVEWLVRTAVDFYTVKAVLDHQELDSRSSTGALYWEGLSDLFDSNGRKVGSGYLEMTGYAKPLAL